MQVEFIKEKEMKFLVMGDETQAKGSVNLNITGFEFCCQQAAGFGSNLFRALLGTQAIMLNAQ